MLRKLGLWLLSEPPADPPSSVQLEPRDGGIAQDADPSPDPVKIEPGLNDFAYPQELLDDGIPGMQCKGNGYNRGPPAPSPIL